MTKNVDIVLIGNPNSGKSNLFNILSGLRVKVANYPGVTVEKRTGYYNIEDIAVSVTDTPGIYSLEALGADELVTLNYIKSIDPEHGYLVFVLDTTNLTKGLYLLNELSALNLKTLVITTLNDVSNRKVFDELLSKRLCLSIFRNNCGKESLKKIVSNSENYRKLRPLLMKEEATATEKFHFISSLVNEISAINKNSSNRLQNFLNFLTTNKYAGIITFCLIMFLFFQSVFFFAEFPMELIEKSVEWAQGYCNHTITNPISASFISDGLIAGVGSFVVFLPQILLLFFFLTLLEDSGYLSRACHVIDYPMRKVGLQGRSFIPLLSSFACAIPGIMSARTISHHKDRLITILAAPFMSCSARLPVYTVLIATLIPTSSWQRSLSMTSLYLLGIFGGLAFALILNLILKSRLQYSEPSFLALELTPFRVPSFKNAFYQSIERGKVFLRDAGSLILFSSIIMWYLLSFPMITDPTTGIVTTPMIRDSYAGKIGDLLEPIFRPIGLSWEFTLAIFASFAAREVFVSTLSTIFSVAEDTSLIATLTERIKNNSIGTASIVAILVFYVFSAQCISTLAIIRRETNSYFWPAILFISMSIIAYLGGYLAYLALT